MADIGTVIYCRYSTHIGDDVIWNIVRLINGKVSHFIPPDPDNSDYKQYLAWVAEGNTATEWKPEA